MIRRYERIHGNGENKSKITWKKNIAKVKPVRRAESAEKPWIPRLWILSVSRVSITESSTNCMGMLCARIPLYPRTAMFWLSSWRSLCLPQYVFSSVVHSKVLGLHSRTFVYHTDSSLWSSLVANRRSVGNCDFCNRRFSDFESIFHERICTPGVRF